jgi:hypothetical protein
VAVEELVHLGEIDAGKTPGRGAARMWDWGLAPTVTANPPPTSRLEHQ